MALSRTDWLLVFIDLPQGSFGTDQLRTTKGMFLFAQQCGGIDAYVFEPYDYGPFSRGLYRDLDFLDGDGLIRRIDIVGTNRQIFETTTKGTERVKALLQDAPPPQIECLAEIKKRVTSLNFTDLLTSIYSEYPAYATRSKAHV